jgi:hypothetical protein
LHRFYHLFQKPGICAYSWCLESMVKVAQWNLSLTTNMRHPDAQSFIQN